MKIVIVGAGEVGTHLAKLLAKEHIDITLMDENPDRLKDLDANYDLMTKQGLPTSINDLRDVGVNGCDLFIAVTPYESVNMTACMIANNLGAKKTLARIDNQEYLQPENKSFFKYLGVDYVIYPEMLAAQQIASALETTWLRQNLNFCNGELIMLGIKVRANAPIASKKFASGFFDHQRYRVVAIKRNNRTIIPGGKDEIEPNDIVFFITRPEELKFVRDQAGKKEHKINSAMIMGGSRIAQKTVQALPTNINVKILEKDLERSYQLAESCNRAMVINGDARDLELLREEGIHETDAFIAVTSNSEANILACLAAKRLGVKKTVAEVENIDYIMLAESMDIGTVINKKMIAASYIYQLTLDADVLDVRTLTSADAEVVEFVAKNTSKITRSKIKDLRLPPNVNIGGYIRNGEGYIVVGDSVIQPGDHVICFCVASAIRKIESYFQ
jgi:trk system potassium uptake protein TrkA